MIHRSPWLRRSGWPGHAGRSRRLVGTGARPPSRPRAQSTPQVRGRPARRCTPAPRRGARDVARRGHAPRAHKCAGPDDAALRGRKDRHLGRPRRHVETYGLAHGRVEAVGDQNLDERGPRKSCHPPGRSPRLWRRFSRLRCTMPCGKGRILRGTFGGGPSWGADLVRW